MQADEQADRRMFFRLQCIWLDIDASERSSGIATMSAVEYH